VSAVPPDLGEMTLSILAYGVACLVAGWVLGYVCGGR
jgi:F0F1-type ATP synthase membrane subunit c/vacuolar-type H+-ATPase subunit K